MPSNLTLFSVNAILILAADDQSRILAKYYSSPHLAAITSAAGGAGAAPTAGAAGAVGGGGGGAALPAGLAAVTHANPYATLKEQRAFEQGLLDKTAKQSADVILYDNRVVVCKAESDVLLCVVGGADENEILLHSVVLALRDTLNILLKNMTDKRTILENYDLVCLAIDELVDDGIVLETDPVTLAARVSRPPAQDVSGVKGIDLSEQGLLNAWEFGKKKLTEQLRQGL